MKNIIAICAILLIVGCDSTGPSAFSESPVTNNIGQTVIYVGYNQLHKWVEDNKNAKIICITGYAAGEQGTSGYIIVYESKK